jgi:hypothetical protein
VKDFAYDTLRTAAALVLVVIGALALGLWWAR